MPAPWDQNPRPDSRIAQFTNSMTIPHLPIPRKPLGPHRDKTIYQMGRSRSSETYNRTNHSRIPKCIIPDNSKPFVNSHVRKLFEQYGVDHVKSTPYYLQGNGQAEATNTTLQRILSRKVYDEPKWRAEFYRTLKRISTQATPFSLVHRALGSSSNQDRGAFKPTGLLEKLLTLENGSMVQKPSSRKDKRLDVDGQSTKKNLQSL